MSAFPAGEPSSQNMRPEPPAPRRSLLQLPPLSLDSPSNSEKREEMKDAWVDFALRLANATGSPPDYHRNPLKHLQTMKHIFIHLTCATSHGHSGA